MKSVAFVGLQSKHYLFMLSEVAVCLLRSLSIPDWSRCFSFSSCNTLGHLFFEKKFVFVGGVVLGCVL